VVFSEDVMKRFVAYGLERHALTDANDLDMLARSYDNFLKSKDQPTLIVVDSHIGYGSPTSRIPTKRMASRWAKRKSTREEKYGGLKMRSFWSRWSLRPIQERRGKTRSRGPRAWKAKFEEYKKQFPQQADQLNRMQSGRLPEGWDKDLPSFPADPKGMATRESSGKNSQRPGEDIPWLIGARQTWPKSNKTNLTF